MRLVHPSKSEYWVSDKHRPNITFFKTVDEPLEGPWFQEKVLVSHVEFEDKEAARTVVSKNAACFIIKIFYCFVNGEYFRRDRLDRDLSIFNWETEVWFNLLCSPTVINKSSAKMGLRI